MDQDKVLNYISHAGFTNQASEKLKIIFVPCYLDGRDGIFNKPYYDLLIGMDATVYPSYYEPWGYTPLESVAFGIPTVTTNLAGFGLWAEKCSGKTSAKVWLLLNGQTSTISMLLMLSLLQSSHSSRKTKEVEEIRKRCFKLAKQAEWSKFIVFYQKAFSDALEAATKRNS